MNKRELLSENVYKEGNTIIKPIKPWTKNIHLLLQHFYNDGLPVPQIIKTDNEYEYLKYIEGEITYPQQWSNELLFELAHLIRKIHNSAKTFEYPESEEWQPNYLRELDGLKIYSHGDIAPWNVVTKGNNIVGLIDWEFAGQICPIVEFARVCWIFSSLPDCNSDKLDVSKLEQIRVMADIYGLNKNNRKNFFETMLATIIYDISNATRNVTVDTVGKMWGIAWRNRNLYWAWNNKDLIQKALNK